MRTDWKEAVNWKCQPSLNFINWALSNCPGKHRHLSIGASLERNAKWFLMVRIFQSQERPVTVKNQPISYFLFKKRNSLPSQGFLNGSTFFINPLTTCQDTSCSGEWDVLCWDCSCKLVHSNCIGHHFLERKYLKRGVALLVQIPV